MSIKLSQKHGVNPALPACLCCGQDVGVALLGQLPGDAKAPRRMTQPGTFCAECEGVMKQGGLMMVEVKDRRAAAGDPLLK